MKFQPEMLLNTNAYNESVENIEIRNTHISWVFLTGNFAYKVKKPVKFGEILDYSTLELRKSFCEKEIELNSRFSPEMYLDTFHIDDTGRINGNGEIIEYGVRMNQIPEKYLLCNLLDEGKVDQQCIESIAKELAAFHDRTNKVPEYGDLKYIGEKWDENFSTTSQFRQIKEDFREHISGYLRGNRGLFKERINEERITDNHGDFQSRNIFFPPEKKAIFFDCIEFNPLLRYGDVAEDVGFLAMDLDFWGENSLSKHFVNSYISFSGDDLLEEHINFFKCYRAYVRGKVYGFQAIEELNEEKKENILNLSEKYYSLAYSYADEF
jgi:aminoglycoside phosphotransferase family enzyme